jgi:beta-glucosidase
MINMICAKHLYPVFLVLIFISCIPDRAENLSSTERFGFDPKYEIIIDSIIAKLTLDEKISMIHGDGLFVTRGVERIGIPELYFTDGPTGVREEMEKYSWNSLNLTTDSVTFFPTGTALAATWNEDLAVLYGQAIGSETRARGKDILLAPGVNIIRTPVCGRNFEYFSEDPFLNSRIAVGYVKGVQAMDVAACVKHFAANNQEHDRGRINVLMDERTLREIYLPVYKATAIEAQAYSFMAAYNKFRGDWMGENPYLLNHVLKNEWGYKGAVMSDWGGTHSTVKAANAGLDIEMGSWRGHYHFSKLADSVKAGLVPEEVINDKVRRVLRISFNCHKMDSTRRNGSANTPEISKIAYDVASEAIVLLKNKEGLLPLNTGAVKSIAVIGENATHPQSRGGFTADVKARYEVSPLEGLKNKLHGTVTINYAMGYREKFMPPEKLGRREARYPDPSPDKQLIKEAVEVAEKSDVAIIIAGTTRNVETEALDRKDIRLPFSQDTLIRAVSRANPNTIVVIVAGAAVDLNLADESVPAILYAWYNGSEAGNALADVLFGDVNPSGKLPFTIPVMLEDLGAHALNAYPGKNLEVTYKEGILVGYRWFDTKGIDPRFCFGSGLSYTAFTYDALKMNTRHFRKEDVMQFSVKLENSGEFDGKEVVQVYIRKVASNIPRADKELKAFKKVLIGAGDTEQVHFEMKISDLAFYDISDSAWTVEPGQYELLVGSSSRDIRESTAFWVKE